jgi:hypothetical protein
MRGNALKHETVTSGTGALTLTSVSGWPSYDDVFGATGTRMVEYVVQDSAGLPLEGGVGELALSTMVLSRSKVQWTWDGTTYDATAPSALSLASGTHQVICGPTVETGGIYAASTTPGDNFGITTGMAVFGGPGGYFFVHQRCEFFWAPIRNAGQISTVSLRLPLGYSGGASSLNVGLYDIDEAGKPFNLIADFGNLGALSTGNKTSGALGTPISVPPGNMYAMAVLPQFSGGSGSPALRVSPGTLGGSPFGTDLAGSRKAIACLGVTGQTSLPADASGLTYGITNVGHPFLVLK